MSRTRLTVALFATTAYSSLGAQSAMPSPAPAARSLYERVPDRVGDFALTERTPVAGPPGDSLYRFSDGSATRVSVVIYAVGDDAKTEGDSQLLTATEGGKFGSVQEARLRRGQITGYVIAFSDTARIAVDDRELLEHSAGVPVRSPNGKIFVELQYLYLIHGKYVKVRGTVPQQGWEQTNVEIFARELARRLAERR